MKRPITNLVMGWLALFITIFQVNGQTTFTVDPQNVTGNPGDQFTVDISVSGFDDILSFQYSMNWDPDVIEFVSPVSVPGNLNGLNANSSFGTNNAANGVLTVSWLDPDVLGVTLANQTVIYTLTFNILSSDGTDISFSGSPTSIEVTNGAGNTVNFEGEEGMVNGGGSGGGGGGNPGDLIITASDETAAAGSNICVDFSVDNFDNILSVQYTMHFDPAILSYTGVDGLNLPGMVSSQFGTNNAGNGIITLSWLDPDVQGVTVPDGTVIYQVCFDVVGSSGQSSSLTIDGNPTSIEVVDGNSDPVGLTVNTGSVTVSGGNPPPPPPPINGFAIIASDQTIESGEDFCIEFSVQDFDNILSMQYTMHYDPSQLMFTQISGLNLDGLVPAQFNTATAGTVTLSWLDPNVAGITLPDGTVIYEICFTAIGPNNCNNSTQLTFDGNPTPIEVLDGDEMMVDFNSSPGVTTICDDPNGGGPTNPPSYTNMTFVASNETQLPGEELCVDVLVYLFECVVSAQYSMHFDPTVLEFTEVNNLNLPGLVSSQFGTNNTDNGVITFSWLDPNVVGVTMPDSTAIYSVCFNVIGTLGETSPFTFDGNPTSLEVTDCNPTNPNPDFVAGTQTVGNSCPGPVSISGAIVTDVECFGANSGSVDISVTGGNNDFSYTWRDASNAQVGSNQDLTGVGPGTYSVTVSSCNGNETATANYTITQPSSGISINGLATPVFCFGEPTGSITLSVTGGTLNFPSCPSLSYAWENGNGDPVGNTKDISNLVPGTYTVTVSDCNNCQMTETFTVTGPPSELVLNATPSPTRCAGECTGQIVASGSGGVGPYEYMLNQQPWQGIGTYNDLCAGTYLLKIRDALGCIKTANIVITSPQALTASATVTNAINGNDGAVDLTPSGGTPQWTFSWIGPGGFTATTEDINNLIAGEYCVTLTDANQCATSLCRTVQEPLMVTGMVAIPSCFGQCTGQLEVLHTGGSPPFSYSWSGSGSGTSNPTNPTLCPGTYSVTVTSADGQTATLMGTIDGALELVEITGVDVSLLSTPNACDGQIQLFVDGGWGNYTYQWSGPTNSTSNPATGLCAGDYTVTVTDQYGCTATGGSAQTPLDYPFVMFFDPSPMSLIATGSNICIEDAADGGTLTIDINGGLAPYNIEFESTDSSGIIDNYQGGLLTLTDLPPGTYTVTVNDAAPGAFGQTKVKVDLIRIIDIQIDTVITPVTSGDDGEIDITVIGGDPIYTFQWSNGFDGQDPSGLNVGEYSLFIEDANGCVKEFTGIEVERFIPNADITLTDCPNDSNGAISLNPSGSLNEPYTYQWSNNAGNVSTIDFLSNGTYWVTITDTLGAFIIDTFRVNSTSNLNVDVDPSGDILCYDDETGGAIAMPFDGVSPYSYEWSNGETTQNISGVKAGIYTVIVTDGADCQITGEVEIMQPDKIDVTISTSNSADCTQGNGNATANPIGGTFPYSYLWDDPLKQTSKTAILLSDGAYTVTVTDENGCTGTGSGVVAQIDALQVEGLSVPDTGGPNGQAIANVISGTPPYSFVWRDFPEQDSILAELMPGTYYVIVSDANNCEELVDIKVDDGTICLEASTIITPEGDGFNEEFQIGCLSRYSDNRLEIYNRWGQLVFLSDNYNNNNLWRGTSRSGSEVPDGVYYYVFKYTNPSTGGEETQKGAVTVLRK